MFSELPAQEKERKYMVNGRGHLLYASTKEGVLPPTLRNGGAFSHCAGKWLFLLFDCENYEVAESVACHCGHIAFKSYGHDRQYYTMAKKPNQPVGAKLEKEASLLSFFVLKTEKIAVIILF
jgi:hypothetical protein